MSMPDTVVFLLDAWLFHDSRRRSFTSVACHIYRIRKKPFLINVIKFEAFAIRIISQELFFSLVKIDFLGASKLSPLGMTEQACLSSCSRSLPASWMRGKNGCKVLPGKYLCVCLWHLKQAKNTDGTNLLSTNFTIQDDRRYPLVI